MSCDVIQKVNKYVMVLLLKAQNTIIWFVDLSYLYNKYLLNIYETICKNIHNGKGMNKLCHS